MLFDSNKAKRSPRARASDTHGLRIYRGKEGLRSSQAPWRELIGKMEKKGFWHFYEWYASYMAALESEPEAMVFCVLYRDNEVVALLPLKEKRMSFVGIEIKVLELPRHSHMKLKDIVLPEPYRTADAIQALVSGLQKTELLDWDCILMTDVLQDSGAMALLKEARGPKLIEKMDTCDYLELGPSYEAFQKKISRNLKKNLRVSNKRAGAVGQLSSAVFHDPEEQKHALQNFLDLELSGWKGPRGERSAIGLSPQLSRFYGQVVESFGELGACEIALLYLNRHPIAAALGLRSKDTLYCLKIAYDEHYANMSPGNLLWEKIIQYHTQRADIKHLNFVSGDSSAWHQRWKPSKLDTFNGYLLRRRLKPMLFYALKQSKRLQKASSEKINPFIGGMRAKAGRLASPQRSVFG